MRRRVAAFLLTLAAASYSFGQANADEARREMDEGSRAYRRGRYAEAEQRFRRALELDPEAKNARLYIARALHQQYKPGDATPENLAAGERAAAAYQELLQRDPQNEDAFRAVAQLYGQMKDEDKLREFLLWRGNDPAAPNEKRAEAFAALAGKLLACSTGVTEQNKKAAEPPAAGAPATPPGAAVRYTMPADAGDHIRARQCMTDGLQFAERAVALNPTNRGALSLKASLLREAAKLAEMEGNAGQKAEYERLHKEAQEAFDGRGARTEPLAVEVGPVTPEQGAGGATVKGGILNGKAISKPQPPYPPEAKAAGVQGTVTVHITVDEGGNVLEAQAVSGHELLREAAVTAARNARFSPSVLSGQPVKVTGFITYSFVLQ